jgi:hypothetical protein
MGWSAIEEEEEEINHSLDLNLGSTGFESRSNYRVSERFLVVFFILSSRTLRLYLRVSHDLPLPNLYLFPIHYYVSFHSLCNF